MLRSYVKIAFKVFLRRKFFTAASLFGISFTLMVLTVAVALLDHVFAPFPPEVHQDRTLGLFSVRMVGPRSVANHPPGYALLDRYARDLPGAERLSIFSWAETAHSYVGGRKLESWLKRTDADFWKILDFEFLEGGPFTSEDVSQARFFAVVNETTRRRFFAEGPAVGKSLEVDGQRFRVVGVVSDVPILRQVPFADIWVPLTTSRGASGGRIPGSYVGIVLARSRDVIPSLKQELRSRLRQFEFEDPKRVDTIIAPLETRFEHAARELFSGRREEESHPERLFAALVLGAVLFMLLPTLNLVNLSVSRILERASEIGVRKAFGASSRTLVGQFVVENVVLTLIGGALGFLLSVVLLEAITASGVIPYAHLRANLRIFGWGLVLALAFGILSGAYPAWRMSRLHPVLALKGGER